MKGRIKFMNLLQAYQLLNMITEDTEANGYREEYKNYIIGHKQRVKEFADWLKENLPELFSEVDLEEFDELIVAHDESKFSEEEFEAYAQHFYGDKKDSKEFDEAWEHHYSNNKHHPEFWDGADMDYIYILEMLCDWGSFSIDKKDFSELSDYYYSEAQDDEEKNLSENTKATIEEIIEKINSIINSSAEEKEVN